MSETRVRIVRVHACLCSDGKCRGGVCACWKLVGLHAHNCMSQCSVGRNDHAAAHFRSLSDFASRQLPTLFLSSCSLSLNLEAELRRSTLTQRQTTECDCRERERVCVCVSLQRSYDDDTASDLCVPELLNTVALLQSLHRRMHLLH